MPSVEEVRATRPQEPAVARILLIMAAVLWVPIVGRLYSDTTVGVVGLVLVMMVFGSFGAVKGRRAGRIVATVAIGLANLFLLPYGALGFRDPEPYSVIFALMDLVAVLLSVMALFQLYHSKTSRYIHRVTVVMRPR